jgi:hypothetical protein
VSDNSVSQLDGVVSCPSCLRQYRVKKSLARKTGQCAACKTHFVINLPEPHEEGEPAIIFDDEIAPHWIFFRAGCAELARYIRFVLNLAGKPVTRESVLGIARSLPFINAQLSLESWLQGEFHRTMVEIDSQKLEVETRERFHRAVSYFLEPITRDKPESRLMLISAFEGVLEGLEFDHAAPSASGERRNWVSWAANYLRELPERLRLACKELRG